MALLRKFVRVLPSPAPPFPVALKAPREEIYAALAFAAILHELRVRGPLNERVCVVLILENVDQL